MKKISFLLLCTVFCTSMFAMPSTTKDYGEELRNDPLFIQQVSKQKELLNQIFESLSYNQSNIDAAKKAIEALQSEKNLTNDQMLVKVNSILKLPNGRGLEVYYNEFKNNWSILKNKYGAKLTDDYLKNETKEVWKTQIANRHYYPCRDRAGFVLCSGGVTATAMAAYAACAGTLFGWPICAGLVAIAQVAGINQCSKDFCGNSITSHL